MPVHTQVTWHKVAGTFNFYKTWCLEISTKFCQAIFISGLFIVGTVLFKGTNELVFSHFVYFKRDILHSCCNMHVSFALSI
jgi:hypothetical protein